MYTKGLFRYCTALLMLLCVSIIPVRAQQQRGPSTPEERAKAVQLARHLEEQPLASDASAARKWLTVWLTEVPDITVEVCFAPLGNDIDPKKKFGAEVAVQSMFSEVAFMIENPDKARDRDAVFVAGVRGALKAYQAIQKENPKLKFKSIDDLVEHEKNGTLDETVKQLVATGCKQNAPGQK